MPPKGSKSSKSKPAPFTDLPPDLLANVACLLSTRDRFKLNLVCRGWRDSLEDAAQVWAAVTIDPRKRSSSSSRVRLNKHLPTPDALGAWFGRHGRHVRQLHLRHLDETARAQGVGKAQQVADLLSLVSGGLRQLVLHHCTLQGLLPQHAPALCALRHLTSLHVHLPLDEELSLGSPDAAFLTCLTGLEDLALATSFQRDDHTLPASLAALPRLRSLQFARVGGNRGVMNQQQFLNGTPQFYMVAVPTGLASGLKALERLVLADVLLEQRPEDEAVLEADAWPLLFPSSTIFGLQALTALVLSDVGLGLDGPSPTAPALLAADNAARAYALPAELSRLAGTLRELALLNHTCGTAELAAGLSALTGLTSLSLTSKWRHAPTPAPESLSLLEDLAQLKLSHGLTQVPACITGLSQLTLLDLSFNRLKSLKPGDYLRRLVAVNLRGNLLSHFPLQLRVARHTCVELQLPQNDSLTFTERDVEQLLTFSKLRQLTVYGASEEKATRRCLATLAKAVPWLLIDV